MAKAVSKLIEVEYVFVIISVIAVYVPAFVLEGEARSIVITSLLIVWAIYFTTEFLKIFKRIEKKLDLSRKINQFFFKMDKETQRSLEILAETISNLDNENDSFFRKVIVDNLNKAEERISKYVYKRNFSEIIKEKKHALINFFESALGYLKKGDCFSTVTNLEFWSNDWINANRSYLAANISAAKRGAIVKRVFIIHDLDENEKEKANDLLKRIKAEDTEAGSDEMGRLETRFIQTKISYHEIMRRYGNYAVINSERLSKNFIIEMEDKFDMKMYFDKENNRFINRFDDLWGKSQKDLVLTSEK